MIYEKNFNTIFYQLVFDKLKNKVDYKIICRM